MRDVADLKHTQDSPNDSVSSDDSDGGSNRTIIFIAHSSGGLIVKDALVQSQTYAEGHRLRTIFNVTKGVIFLGTPHSGDWMGHWRGIKLSELLYPQFQGNDTSLFDALNTTPKYLLEMQQSFETLIDADTSVLEEEEEDYSYAGLDGSVRKEPLTPLIMAACFCEEQQVSLLPGSTKWSSRSSMRSYGTIRSTRSARKTMLQSPSSRQMRMRDSRRFLAS